MNSIKTFAAIAVVALGTVGTAAQAQFLRADSDFIVPPTTSVRADAGTPLTRTQVVAEREQARRDGTLVTDFVTGKPVFAVDVSAPQREVTTTGKTRADVRAEVARAQRDGTLVTDYVTGKPYFAASPRATARQAGAE